jgi:hypothetical protein
MLQSYVTNVLSVFSDVYCKCVYLDVAYISHICCKYFYLDVAYISHICCKCFYLNVAYVCNDFQVFLGVSEACFKCLSVFFCMLQVLYLDVIKVDRVSAADSHLVGVNQISSVVSRIHDS